jgi:hypothetical protein
VQSWTNLTPTGQFQAPPLGGMNRVISSIEEEDRPAFLKGILVGVAIRKVADVLAEPDLTDEEKRIDHEIEKLRFSSSR